MSSVSPVVSCFLSCCVKSVHVTIFALLVLLGERIPCAVRGETAHAFREAFVLDKAI